jgi:arylsulfatase A-like enzyme
VPLLKHTSAGPKDRAFVWHYPNNWGPKGPGIGASSTIRKGDWKLIYYHADQRYELFNIAEDVSETRNLASHQAQRSAELAGELRRYLESVGAQMPTDR